MRNRSPRGRRRESSRLAGKVQILSPAGPIPQEVTERHPHATFLCHHSTYTMAMSVSSTLQLSKVDCSRLYSFPFHSGGQWGRLNHMTKVTWLVSGRASIEQTHVSEDLRKGLHQRLLLDPQSRVNCSLCASGSLWIKHVFFGQTGLNQ